MVPFFVCYGRKKRSRRRGNPEPISATNAVAAALTSDLKLYRLRVREQIELSHAEPGVVDYGSL